MKTDVDSIFQGQDITDPTNNVQLATVDGYITINIINQPARLDVLQAPLTATGWVDATTASNYFPNFRLPHKQIIMCRCEGRKPITGINVTFNFILFNLTYTFPFNVTTDTTHMFVRVGHPHYDNPMVEECYTPLCENGTITFNVDHASPNPNPEVFSQVVGRREIFA